MDVRRFLLCILTGMMMLTAAGAVSDTLARPSAHSVYVDGHLVQPAAYEIAGNNYIKLRDLALLVNGTDKQFSVEWSEADKCIFLRTDMPYQPVGGELSSSLSMQQANLSTHRIYIDALPKAFMAYEVAGNNYFKLRDLASALDIGIGWDEALRRVDIFTTRSHDNTGREKMLPIDYLGITMDELGDLWGYPFSYMDDWYSGNAKGVYYHDHRVPMAFYYYDANFAGYAQGPELIVLVSFGQDAYPQIGEIAPGLPINTTYADLCAKGYQAALYTDPDEMGGENSSTAYCSIYKSGVEIYFYWYDDADPYTVPADFIEVYADDLIRQLAEG